MSSPLLRRSTTVSAGALALCLACAGTAFADTTTTLPGVPSPDNVITTLDQTVTSVTGTDPTTTTTTTVPTTTGTTPTTTTPTTTVPSTTGTAPTTTTTTNMTSTQTATRTPTTARHATVSRVIRHAAAAPAMVSAATTYAAPMPAAMQADLALPPATSMAPVAGPAPAVAPLLIPQSTQHITPAAAQLLADKHTGPPVRGILLTLAIAAALGLGYEHLRLARSGLPV